MQANLGEDSKRKRLSAAERREALLDVAAEIIQKQGLERLTMEQLASASHVNKALPYRHFSNRDDVLLQLYRRENEHFDKSLTEKMSVAASFGEQLNILVSTWHSAVIKGKVTPELMQARPLESERNARLIASVEFIADLIQSHFDLNRSDAKLAASVLLAGSQGLAALWRSSDANHATLNASFVKMSVGAVGAIASS